MFVHAAQNISDIRDRNLYEVQKPPLLRFYVSGIAKRQTTYADIYLCPCLPITQAVKPFCINLGLANFDHSLKRDREGQIFNIDKFHCPIQNPLQSPLLKSPLPLTT